jgi:hypothetical protein
LYNTSIHAFIFFGGLLSKRQKKGGLMKSRRELTAPCGLDCFNCKVYSKNITPATQSRLSRMLSIDEDSVPCKGCREQRGRRLNFPECATFNCASQKGVEFCFECDQFPCDKMQPIADGLRWYPHNLKLYNLCRIKMVGVENWIENEAAANRFRYLHSKLVEGMGEIQTGASL